MPRRRLGALRRLAQLWNVQLRFRDVFGRSVDASPEALLGVLRALGAPIERVEDAEDALRARTQELQERLIEPVVVAWEGSPAALTLRLPARLAEARAEIVLELEEGGERRASVELRSASARGRTDLDGESYVEQKVALPDSLPLGYHSVVVDVGDRSGRCLLLHAPRRAVEWEGKHWGIFLPLYALRTERAWSTADFTDLGALLDWTGEHGGSIVATLPLLATFLEEEPLFEPSPYSPVTRLFWNEVYLDVEGAPEIAHCPEARELLASDAFRAAVAEARGAPEIDYRLAIELKRRVVEPLARCAVTIPERAATLDAAAAGAIGDYARFRATCVAQGKPWPAWDAQASPDEAAMRYHLYAQVLADEQVRRLDGCAATLLFDLPLGVHPHGYDTWRYQESFSLAASGGAPPDSFFTKGQNWAFPPLHPERLRADGYRYPIACLRQLLAHARVLRVDHVMGFHRLWWVPEGAEASDGAYVRYRPEEWYALAAIESHRASALIVGEDLGTVPREVRRAMSAHAIQRMYVLQEELDEDEQSPANPVPAGAAAYVNTHDMPTFAAFWELRDIALRTEMGLFDEEQAAAERARRQRLRALLAAALRRDGFMEPPEDPNDGSPPTATEALRASLRRLTASPARAVVVNLEDLWAETEPQNVPGTPGDQNWRRKGRYAFENIRTMPEVLDVLGDIDRLRKGRR